MVKRGRPRKNKKEEGSGESTKERPGAVPAKAKENSPMEIIVPLDLVLRVNRIRFDV